MDATDVLIFCEMAFKYTDYHAPIERRVSPSEIGRKLGIDEKTVRLRVKRMEDAGFIKYYQVIPNLGLFGFGHLAMYAFEAKDIAAKQEAVLEVQRQPRIVEIIDSVGPGFSATLAASSDDELQQTAVEIANDLGVKRLFRVTDRPMADSKASPSRLDWQIVQACRYNALRPASEIAEQLSITPRIVEYRLTKLLESRACFIRAMINVRDQKGIIFYALILFFDESTASDCVSWLQAAYGTRLWSIVAPRPLRTSLVARGVKDKMLRVLAGKNYVVAANLFAETPGEPEAALMKALQLRGVKRGVLSIVKEWIEPRPPTWIDDLLEAKIASETS